MGDFAAFLEEIRAPSLYSTPNLQILDELEDFLIFSLDSELSPLTEYLIAYLCHFVSVFEDSSGEADFKIHVQLLKLLRMLRPNLLSKEQTLRIQGVFLNTIYKFTDTRRGIGLGLFLNQSLCAPRSNTEKVKELAVFLTRILKEAGDNFEGADLSLIRLIIESFRSLLTVLDVHDMSVVPAFADELVRFTAICLQHRNREDFFPNIAVLAAKGLRLLSRFMEHSSSDVKRKIDLVSGQVVKVLGQMQNDLVDDPRFCHIYENYLLCLYFGVRLDDQKRDLSLLDVFVRTTGRLFPLLIQPPFSRSRRVIVLISKISVLYTRETRKTLDNFDRVMTFVWPLIGNVHYVGPSVSYRLVGAAISNELFKENANMMIAFCSELCAGFRIMEHYFKLLTESGPVKHLEIESWLEYNREYISIVCAVMKIYYADQSARSDSAIFVLLLQIVDYAVFLLDIFGLVCHPSGPQNEVIAAALTNCSLKDFREKVFAALDVFFSLFSILPGPVSRALLDQCMYKLMPTKPHHVYHKQAHQLLMKNLSDHNSYFAVFFRTLSTKFDLLFLPEPQPALVDLTRQIFQEVFMADNKQGPQGVQSVPSSISNDLFNFLMKGLASKNSLMLHLLLNIIAPVARSAKQPPHKLPQFVDKIRNCPFGLRSMMKLLSDEPKLTETAAFLSLCLLVMCDTGKREVNWYEFWVSLFTPAFEGENAAHAGRILYTYLSRDFGEWVKRMKRPVQSKLVNQLMGSVTNLSGQEAMLMWTLLNKIPDVTAELSLGVYEPKAPRRFVVIDGRTLDLDIIVELIKKEEKLKEEDAITLRECYVQFLNSVPFELSVTNKQIHALVELIGNKFPQILRDVDDCFVVPSLYTHLFFKHMCLPDDCECSKSVSKPEEFLTMVCLVASNRLCASTSLSIIGELLTNRIPFCGLYPRVLTAVLHASTYDFDQAKKVIIDHMLRTEVDSDPKVAKLQNDLFGQFVGISLSNQRTIRKLGILGMKFYRDHHAKTCSPKESRFRFLKELPHSMQEARKTNGRVYAARWEFVTMYSMSDYPEKLELMTRLLDVLETLPLVNLPPEIRTLFKDFVAMDEATCTWSNFKFALKLIVKCLVVMSTDPAVTRIWERLFGILRQEKFHVMLPYVTKYTERELKQEGLTEMPSLPAEPMNLFATPGRPLPAVSCSLEDVMIVRYVYRFSALRPTSDFLHWIMLVLRAFEQQKIHIGNESFLKTLFRLIGEIYAKCDDASIHLLEEIVLQAIKICLLPHAAMFLGRSPLRALAKKIPDVVLRMFCTSITRTWSSTHIVILSSMLVDPKLAIFREKALDLCLSSFDTMAAFLANLPRFAYDFSISHLLPVLAHDMASLNFTEVQLCQLLELLSRFLSFAKRRGGDKLPYRPGLLIGAIDILIPIAYVNLFIAGSTVLEAFTTKAIPTMLSLPQLFHRRTVVLKVAAFIRAVENDVKEIIFNQVHCYAAADMAQKAFVFAILSEFYKCLPLDQSFSISVGFSSFPKQDMFPLLKLQYYGLSLGMNHNVRVEDVSDCDVCWTSPQLSAPAIMSGYCDFSTCQTLTQLVHVYEILHSQNCYAMDKVRNSEFLSGIVYNDANALRYSLSVVRNESRYTDFFDFSNRIIVNHLMSTITTAVYARAGSPDRTAMLSMTSLFKELARDCPQCIDRMLEICLFACRHIQLLQKLEDASACENLHSTIEVLLPLANKARLNKSLIGDIKSLLVKKNEPHAQPTREQQALEIIRMKFVLRVLPALAPVALVGLTEIPAVLSAECIEKVIQSRDTLPFFQKSVQEVGRYGGLAMQQLVVDQMYEVIKRKFQNLPKSERTPFATVARWFAEKPTDAKELKTVMGILHVFLEAVKPMTEQHFVLSLRSLKAPVHLHVCRMVEQLLDNEFQNVRDSPTYRPITAQFVMPEGTGLVQDLWKFDWFSIDEAIHMPVFLRIISPRCIHHLLSQLNNSDSLVLLATMAQALVNVPGFSRFFEYYHAFWPKSRVSESFFTLSLFKTEVSESTAELTHNIKYLEYHNFYDDALGLIKYHYPCLSNAAGYHQISNYRAAKSYYLKAMDEHPSEAYFQGLCQLRRVSLGLTLPTTQDLYEKMVKVKRETNFPEIHIPFWDDVPKNGNTNFVHYKVVPEVTSTLSSVYLPDIMKSCVVDEVIASLKALQERGNPRNGAPMTDISRPFSLFPIKSLDKHNAMSSLIWWRLTTLQRLHAMETPQISLVMIPGQHRPNNSDTYKELARANRAFFACALMKSGASHQALKQFEISASDQDPNQLSVTPQAIPRILLFLRRLRLEGRHIPSTLLQITYLKLHCFFPDLTKFIQNPTQHVTRQWLTAFIAVDSLDPNLIDPQAIFLRIQKELSMVSADKAGFYIEICVYLMRRNPRFAEHFAAIILEQAKGELQGLLLLWLSVLLSCCGNHLEKFMLHLAKTALTDLILRARHAKYSGMVQNPSYIDEFFERIQMIKDVPRAVASHESAFKWLITCEEDIAQLTSCVEAHFNLYKILASADVDEEKAKALAQFCGENRPVFTTKETTTCFSASPMIKFNSINHTITHFTLKSDGSDEAKLQAYSSTGEVISFTLVSPRLYNFSHTESFFVQAIQRLVEEHPSSRERSKCLSYPFAILLKPGLMMVYVSALLSQQTLCDANIPRLLTEARLATRDCASPAGVREKRKIDVDREFYFNHLAKFTAGRKLDFLFAQASIASHIAGFSLLRCLFQRSLPAIPSLCFLKSPAKVCIPGFLEYESQVPLVPLTPAVKAIFPPHVLKGSFSTTWNAIADVLGSHSEKLRIILGALGSRDGKSDDVDQFVTRAKRLSVEVTSETEKLDEPFPFLLLDHLIETGQNIVCVCDAPYSWI